MEGMQYEKSQHADDFSRFWYRGTRDIVRTYVQVASGKAEF